MDASAQVAPTPREGTDQSAQSADANRREGLLLEYVQCNEFYNSRDVITGDLFTKLIQSFSTFAAILVALSIFGQLPSTIYRSIVLAIGLFGFVSFISIMLDMQGAASVKVAARLRAQEIEHILESLGGPRLWHEISQRNVFFEEKLLKMSKLEDGGGKREKETEGLLFVLGARLALVLWIILVGLVLVVVPATTS